MRIRYPEGLRSIVDAEPRAAPARSRAPLLGGTVTVRDAVWTRRFEPSPTSSTWPAAQRPVARGAGSATLPLRFDVDIDAPSTLRVENNIAQMVASADLRLQGTYDRPLLFGRAEIERGDIMFEGNRYVVTRGTHRLPQRRPRIEPFFDIEAETRVRVPEPDLPRHARVHGHDQPASVSLNSDPPLPEVDIISLLLRPDRRTSTDAELRALQPNAAPAAEEVLLQGAAARLLTGPISAPVGRVDGARRSASTRQIAPTIGTDSDPLTPSARLILGKRLSNRAYLTFARPLGRRHPRSDHRARIRPDRSPRLGADAERRQHVRDRFPRPPQVLMRWLLAAPPRRVPAAAHRRRTAAAGAPPRASRAPESYLGKPIAQVHVLVEGQPTTDPRSSIWSRRASASRCRWRPCARPSRTSTASGASRTCRWTHATRRGGVALRYNLVAVQQRAARGVSRHARPVGGAACATRSNDRFGRAAGRTRAPKSSARSKQLYQDNGYLAAVVPPQSTELHDPERTVLMFDIDAGAAGDDRPRRRSKASRQATRDAFLRRSQARRAIRTSADAPASGWRTTC